MTTTNKMNGATVGTWRWAGRGTYTMVTLADGTQIKFLDRLSKREALRQAAMHGE